MYWYLHCIHAINTYITPKRKTSIDASIIDASFLKRGISNAIDGPEDHLIREEIPKDVDDDEDDDNLDLERDIDDLDHFKEGDN